MNFLESLFNMAPDGGAGFTETAILITIGLLVAAVVLHRLARRGKLNKSSISEN